MAENIVRTLKVRLFTTKVIKSHVKLHVKSNATKIPRESTQSAILRVALSWPPRKPTVFARLTRRQLIKSWDVSCDSLDWHVQAYS